MIKIPKAARCTCGVDANTTMREAATAKHGKACPARKGSPKPRTSGKHKHPVCRIPATHAQREAWARAAHGQPFAVHARALLDGHAEAQGIEIADKIGEENEDGEE